MATFKGFNTIGATKKFTLTDKELIKRDLLNMLSIRQGEVPGRPEVGSNIWALLFEQQTNDTLQSVETELERVVGLDPRLGLVNIVTYPQEHGMLIELEVNFVPNADAELLRIFFDLQNPDVSLV